MTNFMNHIKLLIGDSFNHGNLLLPFFEKKTVVKGQVLLRPGDKVSSAWNVNSGVLRAYYYHEESKHTWKNKEEISVREVTTSIVSAPDFLTDFTGFLFDKPSEVYIEALEACELYGLSQKNYKSIQKQFPELASLIFERSLGMVESRVRLLHLRRPIDRLEKVEELHPGLSNRISVNTMASYLNVDPTTLSKIRSKR
jgi:CRP-like cAMP-binding protein